MAVIWSRQEGDTRYEVRQAGNSRRLYTDGMFHSQYNPRTPVTGSVWDLLILPAFFRPQQIRRVLVLGVGGGTVIRQLNHFMQPELIVGVELSQVHLDVAREFFDVEADNVELHQADAIHWLKQYRGEAFDLIIDDIFGGVDGEAERAIAVEGPWMRRLLKALTPHGTLVVNFGSPAELKSSAWFTQPTLHNKFPSAFKLATPLCENAIGAFLRYEADSAELRNNLKTWPELDPGRQSCRLNYSIRRLQAD